MDMKLQEACSSEKHGLACTNIASQYADVSVPLKLKPYTVVGKLATECCGEPVIALHQGGSCLCGCEITITQTVCIKIPIEYGAEADVGDTTVICKKAPNCQSSGANIECR